MKIKVKHHSKKRDEWIIKCAYFVEKTGYVFNVCIESVDEIMQDPDSFTFHAYKTKKEKNKLKLIFRFSFGLEQDTVIITAENPGEIKILRRTRFSQCHTDNDKLNYIFVDEECL